MCSVSFIGLLWRAGCCCSLEPAGWATGHNDFGLAGQLWPGVEPCVVWSFSFSLKCLGRLLKCVPLRISCYNQVKQLMSVPAGTVW